jgi:hypothetical protein
MIASLFYCRMTYQQFSSALFEKAVELTKQWRCPLPAHNQVESISDEAACDSWCEAFATQPDEIPHSGPSLRPSLLVRLLSAAGCARQLANDGQIPPAVAPSALVKYFLIRAWKSDLKFRWRALAADSRFEPN